MAEAKKIYIYNKKNGVTYIYLDEPYWDKETKSSRHKRKCIGRLDENGNEVFNDYYQRLQKETGEDIPLSVSKTVKLGERLICEDTARQTGVVPALRKVFGKETAASIEALSYYQMCTARPYAYAEPWLDERGWEYGLSSAAISDRFARIGEDEMNAFFKVWLGRNMGKKNILFDITSVSSYADIIGVERGHNRDRENLEQINVALLSTYDTRKPLLVKKLNGSLSDVTVLRQMMDTLMHLGVPSFSIMADRGFYSDKNLKYLHENRIGFTLPVPSSVGWQKEMIKENAGKLYGPKNLIRPQDGKDEIVYAKTFYEAASPYGRVWKHLYYDPIRKERETAKLMEKISRCMEELESGNVLEKNASFYGTYFTVRETAKRGRKVTVNDSAVQEFLDGESCYWVILSSVEKDPAVCLKQYRMRNNVELHFDDLKNAVDCNRLRVHNEKTLAGKLFISFISLILISRLRENVDKVPGKDIRYWNWKEVLAYASSYGKCQFNGKYKDVYTVPTKGQRMIFKALNIPYFWKGKKVQSINEDDLEKEINDTDISGEPTT